MVLEWLLESSRQKLRVPGARMEAEGPPTWEFSTTRFPSVSPSANFRAHIGWPTAPCSPDIACCRCFGIAAFLAQILVPAEGGEEQLGSQAQAPKSPGERTGRCRLLGETESTSDSVLCLLPEVGGLESPLHPGARHLLGGMNTQVNHSTSSKLLLHPCHVGLVCAE